MSYETPRMTKMLLALGVMPPCFYGGQQGYRSGASSPTSSIDVPRPEAPPSSGVVVPASLRAKPQALSSGSAECFSSEKPCGHKHEDVVVSASVQRNERNCRRQKKNRGRRRGR